MSAKGLREKKRQRNTSTSKQSDGSIYKERQRENRWEQKMVEEKGWRKKVGGEIGGNDKW
jgi:hypothetical protein